MAIIGTTLSYYKIDLMAPPPYGPRLEGGVLQKAGDNIQKASAKSFIRIQQKELHCFVRKPSLYNERVVAYSDTSRTFGIFAIFLICHFLPSVIVVWMGSWSAEQVQRWIMGPFEDRKWFQKHTFRL